MSSTPMWTSKLGAKYPMAWIQQNDLASQKQLKQLRGLLGNGRCADCDRQDNSWASVSHGVFICVTCSDVHRSVGTHVTKVKGCTGTYLWGPDELERMAGMGNRSAEEVYGTEKVEPSASKEQKQRYVMEKYERRSFASRRPKEEPFASPVRSAPNSRQVELVATGNQKANVAMCTPKISGGSVNQSAPVARKIDDTFFDDFFNELQSSCFDSATSSLKPARELKAQAASQPQSGSERSLDDFLNLTLNASSKGVTASKFTVAAGVKMGAQRASADLDFSDWPDF